MFVLLNEIGHVSCFSYDFVGLMEITSSSKIKKWLVEIWCMIKLDAFEKLITPPCDKRCYYITIDKNLNDCHTKFGPRWSQHFLSCIYSGRWVYDPKVIFGFFGLLGILILCGPLKHCEFSTKYPKTSNIRRTFIGDNNCWSLSYNWTGAAGAGARAGVGVGVGVVVGCVYHWVDFIKGDLNL